jgi:hypothetical protein
VAFECADVEQFRQDLIEKGYFKEIPEIKPSNNGMRLFAMKDPDGIMVQFYQGSPGFNDAIRPSIAEFSNQRA